MIFYGVDHGTGHGHTGAVHHGNRHRVDPRSDGGPSGLGARTLLLKLERRGLIELPARQRPSSNEFRNRRVSVEDHASEPIHGSLVALRPLSVSVVAPGSTDGRLFNSLLTHHHYLGHRNTVGDNLRYLIRDQQKRPVGCALFGSAAWKCADHDAFLGWQRAARERNLQELTNNTRFLVLPWVEVPHLASHVLSLITRRIHADWQAKSMATRCMRWKRSGSQPFPGNLLPGRELATVGSDPGTHPQRPGPPH